MTCQCSCATCLRRVHVNMRPLDGYEGQSRLSSTYKWKKISNTLPVSVDDDLSVGYSSYASGRVFAIADDGGLWAWGNGLLGDGKTNGSACPVFIDHGPWREVSDGYGIKEDGSLWVLAGNIDIPYVAQHSTSASTRLDCPVSVTLVPDQHSAFRGRGLYMVPPIIKVDPPYGRESLGRPPVAHAVLSSYVHAIAVTSGGANYSSPPRVTAAGVPSAVLEAEINGGAVVAVRIVDRGVFRMRGPDAQIPALEFSGGGGSGAAAIMYPLGSIADIEMIDGGSGYERAEKVTAVRQDRDQAALFNRFPPNAHLHTVVMPGDCVVDRVQAGSTYSPVNTKGAVRKRGLGTYYVLRKDYAQSTTTTRQTLVATLTGNQADTSKMTNFSGTPHLWATLYGGMLYSGVVEEPYAAVLTAGKGSGAKLRVDKVVQPIDAVNSRITWEIHLEEEGSGYEFAPTLHVRFTVRGDSLEFQYSPNPLVDGFGPVAAVVRTTQDPVENFWHMVFDIDGHPATFAPQWFMGDEPPDTLATEVTYEPLTYQVFPDTNARVIATGRGRKKYIPSHKPMIADATGAALVPTPASQFHPDFAGEWIAVAGSTRGNRVTAGWYNRGGGYAIKASGEIWCWGRETSSRTASKATAPMPVGGDVVQAVQGNLAGRYLPPPRGSGGTLQGYTSAPSDSFNFYPQVPVARFEDGISSRITSGELTWGFYLLQANGNAVYLPPDGFDHTRVTTSQFLWLSLGIGRKVNGGAVILASSLKETPVAPDSPLHSATSVKNRLARLPDGRLVDFDSYGNATRYRGLLEAKVTDPGAGYKFPAHPVGPGYTFSNGLQFPWQSGGVYAVIVEDAGGGYQSAPEVSFSGSGGAAAHAVIEGPVVSVEVTNPGSGYTRPPRVLFGRPGVPAQATAQLNRDGSVARVLVRTGGRFRGRPTVTLESVDGNGGGATATATLDGRIAFVRVTSIGSYSSAPAVNIPGAKAHAVLLYEWQDVPVSPPLLTAGAIIAHEQHAERYPQSGSVANVFWSSTTNRFTNLITYPYNKLRSFFRSRPLFVSDGSNVVVPVTEGTPAIASWSHPFAQRYPPTLTTTYETNLGLRLVFLTDLSDGVGVSIPTNTGRVWHDGPIAAEVCNVLGQGATLAATRSADGGISGWSPVAPSGDKYSVELFNYSQDPGRSIAEVTLPIEGRPAAVSVQVQSHQHSDGSVTYTVTGLTVESPGAYVSQPHVVLRQGDVEVPLTPVMGRSIWLTRAPDLNHVGTGVVSPNVVVGGAEIVPASSDNASANVTGGLYAGEPRVYRNGQSLRVYMSRYWQIASIRGDVAAIHWSAPPEIVITPRELPSKELWRNWYTLGTDNPYAALEVEHIKTFARRSTGYVEPGHLGSSTRDTIQIAKIPGSEWWHPPGHVVLGHAAGRVTSAKIYNHFTYRRLSGATYRYGSFMASNARTFPGDATVDMSDVVIPVAGGTGRQAEITVSYVRWADLLDDQITQRL